MLGNLFAPRSRASVTWSPLNMESPGAQWFEGLGTRSDAGIGITAETALSIGVVYRAVNVLAHAIASIPLVVYRDLPGENGKEKAYEHPQYRLLHDAPNAWQTSFDFRHLLMVRAILWGEFFSQIMPGPGGISQLVPLSPRYTRVVNQLADGRLEYVTRDENETLGPERRLLQDNVFSVRGFSLDGKQGLPLTKLARNAMGLALAAEKHGSMFLKRGSTFLGILSTPGEPSDETRLANEKAWNRALAKGAEGSGTAPLLTGGIDFKPTSTTNRDSQWVEARDHQVEDLLRFVGVPGVLCGYADKTSTYASAEQFFLSFVTHVVRPWTENIRAQLNRSVVIGADTGEFFADFVLEGLLRGDIRTRYESHRIAVMTGWKSRNEVRRDENMNPGPTDLDEFFEPLNLGIAGEPNEPTSQTPPPPPGQQQDQQDQGQEDQSARMLGIARYQAKRLRQKELTALAKTGAKLSTDAEAWGAWLDDFYSKQARELALCLQVPLDRAEEFCQGCREKILSDGLIAVNLWSEDDLVKLVLGGAR